MYERHNLHSNINNTMAADRQEYNIDVWEVVVAVSDIVVGGLTGRIHMLRCTSIGVYDVRDFID